MNFMNRASGVLAVVASILASLSLLVTVVTSDDGNGHRTRSIEFHVNQGRGDGAPTREVRVPVEQVQEVNAGLPDKHMRDETPALAEQLAPGQLTAAQKEAARIRATQPPLPTAGATQGVPGCRTLFVQNQSSRNGVRPQQVWLHYTVSHNVPGWADVLAVVHLFDTRSFQASSHFVIDAEGNCAYIVPIENKSWTEAAANPFAVGIEVIDFGNEPTYMGTAGYAKLGQVSLTISQRTGIPIVQGIVRGCVPIKRGFVQHADGGICSGGHHDINPFSLVQVIRLIQANAHVGPLAKPISARARTLCVELNTIRRHTASYHRRYGRRPVPPIGAAQRARAATLRGTLRRHGYKCVVGAPGKRGLLSRR